MNEYPDRKEEAALAIARLGSTGGTAPVASTKGDRAVWTGRDVLTATRVSSDGRFITGTDRNGSLFVHDVASNVDRVLTPPLLPSEWADNSAVSRDGKQVAYEWWDQNNRVSMRVVAVTGKRTPGAAPTAPPSTRDRFRSFDWSPDGKWIAALMERFGPGGVVAATVQIALIAAADGSLRELKSMPLLNSPNEISSPPTASTSPTTCPAARE